MSEIQTPDLTGLRESLEELAVVLPKVIEAVKALLEQIPEEALTPKGRLVSEDHCEICEGELVVEVAGSHPGNTRLEPCPCIYFADNTLAPGTGLDLDEIKAARWLAEVEVEIGMGASRPHAEWIVNKRWGITQ